MAVVTPEVPGAAPSGSVEREDLGEVVELPHGDIDTRVEPPDSHSLVGRVLEQVLAGYHRLKRHGGADRVTINALDGLLAATTERAFRRADPPPDAEVLRTLEDAEPELLGEGYHVVTLCDRAHQFVVKYAKSSVAIPPLAPPEGLSDRRAWATDHGVGEDGRLHEAIWQHLRAFESYGQLTVPKRIYIAGDVFEQVDGEERRVLDRFRALGIVRLMGDRALRSARTTPPTSRTGSGRRRALWGSRSWWCSHG
jgi:hypothetical protein